jgi:hypothetical protein
MCFQIKEVILESVKAGVSSHPYERAVEIGANRRVAEVVQRIIMDHDLRKGFWYPKQYHDALKEGKKVGRLDWLKSRGHFFHGFLPPTYFRHSEGTSEAQNCSPTEKITEFKISKGVSPSGALDGIFSSFALVDCSNICQIAQYQAIREEIGDEKFDVLFTDRLIIGDYMPNPRNPLMRFLLPCHDGKDFFAQMVKKKSHVINDPIMGLRDLRSEPDQIPIGARVVIQNIDSYASKHPVGSSAGFNVINAGEGRYYAFGISIEAVPLSVIIEFLISAYNKPRSGSEHLDEKAADWYEKNCLRFAAYNDSQIRDFKKEGGGFSPFSGKRLNDSLIKSIKETAIAELSWEKLFSESLALYL